MARAVPILALLLLVPAASYAEEEGGPDCGLFAVLRGDDQGERAIYDGIRKGLELARLPRVCLEEIDPWPGGLRDFGDQLLQGGDPGPLFGIGDEACRAMAALETTYPRVFVVQRYSVQRKPLKPLPEAPGAAVVYADVGAERLGQVLRGLCGTKEVRVVPAWELETPEDEVEALARFGRAAGLVWTSTTARPAAQAVLHLRLGQGERPLPFRLARALAKTRGIPLVSDDRGRFGQGAVVTLVPTQDLVGRAAAEAGRRLRADPQTAPAPRAIRSVEVWVDLHAADTQGLELPLPFVATADRLKRSRVSR